MNINFYTQPNCPLCDEAEEKLEYVCETFNVSYEKINIHSDDDLLETYQLRVPVITANNQTLAEGSVFITDLEKSIRSLIL